MSHPGVVREALAAVALAGRFVLNHRLPVVRAHDPTAGLDAVEAVVDVLLRFGRHPGRNNPCGAAVKGRVPMLVGVGLDHDNMCIRNNSSPK